MEPEDGGDMFFEEFLPQKVGVFDCEVFLRLYFIYVSYFRLIGWENYDRREAMF
jgi:hypothetical protein